MIGHKEPLHGALTLFAKRGWIVDYEELCVSAKFWESPTACSAFMSSTYMPQGRRILISYSVIAEQLMSETGVDLLETVKSRLKLCDVDLWHDGLNKFDIQVGFETEREFYKIFPPERILSDTMTLSKLFYRVTYSCAEFLFQNRSNRLSAKQMADLCLCDVDRERTSFDA